MKYVHFYATPLDVLPVLRRLEADEALKYIPTGKKAEINRPIYLNSSDIPYPGISTSSSGTFSSAYLVSPREIKSVMYTFLNDKQQRRWLLSNGDNPDSVVLTLAGLWITGSLLPGNMSTLHNTPNAQRIMRKFLEAIKAEGFTKYNEYWLGGQAIEMLQAGCRLVHDEQSPTTYNVPKQEDWDRSDA